MVKKHPNIWKDPKKESLGSIQGTIDPTTGKTFSYCKKTDRMEFAKFIAGDALPFTTGQSSGLRNWITKAHNPLYAPIPRTTVRHDIFSDYTKYQSTLRELFGSLKSRASLTSYIGHAENKLGFLTLVIGLTMIGLCKKEF